MVYVRVISGVRYVSMACVKRKISYNPWRGWHQVVIITKFAVCKFKWSITKRSCLKLSVHCDDNGLVKMCRREAHP